MDFHQVHECTLTSLLVREEGSKRSTERDIVGLSGDSRLVYMSAQADLDDHLTLNRAMLKRYALFLRNRNNLTNYILSITLCIS